MDHGGWKTKVKFKDRQDPFVRERAQAHFMGPADLLFMILLSGCATLSPSKNILPPQSLQNLPAETHQAIVVEPLNSSRARITTWERKDNQWRQVFWPMRAMVGRQGIAPLNEKREGDSRTPS